MQQGFDPYVKVAEKLLVEPTAEAAGKDQVEGIKARIAGKVRADAKEHAALTLSDTVFALVPDSLQGSITAILEEMAAEDGYGDIKALVTPTGGVYFFSTTYLPADEAFAKSVTEEVKDRMAERVRGDSRDRVTLTPDAVLYDLTPGTERGKIDDLLTEMQGEARYADIHGVPASSGEVYFYSDIYLSDNYAKILLRAMANDPCATIAETVRDASRIFPKPTMCCFSRKGSSASTQASWNPPSPRQCVSRNSETSRRWSIPRRGRPTCIPANTWTRDRYGRWSIGSRLGKKIIRKSGDRQGVEGQILRIA